MKWVQKIMTIFVPHAGNDHKPSLLREEGITALLIVIVFVTVFSFSGKIAIRSNFLTASVQSALLADLANENRSESNLSELVWSDTLAQAAQLKANDMAEKSYFAHTSPDGDTPWTWFTKAGYVFQYAGENLAVNYTESIDVDEAWMDSPTHRANILNGNFTEIGVATAVGQYKGKETTFVVQMFAKPLFTSFPSTSQASTVTATVEMSEFADAPVQNSEVLGESLSLTEAFETLELTDTYIAVENTSLDTAPQSAGGVVSDAPVSASTFVATPVAAQGFSIIDNSVHYAREIYRVLFAIVSLSLLLMIVIEYKKQHYKNIAYGALVLLLIGFLFFLLNASAFTRVIVV